VPLYHQIAEALRYQIATGRLTPGQALPSLRDAARLWNVNRHTVQRAYSELVRETLIEMNGAQGTHVLGVTKRCRVDGRERRIEKFLDKVLQEAHEHYKLTPSDLVHRLSNWIPSVAHEEQGVYVVECSEDQCMNHAAEIERYWDVSATPWCLDQKGEPPSGSIVATYFHYNDLRQRWPARMAEIFFTAIHPNPVLRTRIEEFPNRGSRQTLNVCEFDAAKALNIAADVSTLLPHDKYVLKPCVVEQANECLISGRHRSPVLFAPRVWSALSPTEQSNRLALKVSYVISREDMDAIGSHFGWRRRSNSRYR